MLGYILRNIFIIRCLTHNLSLFSLSHDQRKEKLLTVQFFPRKYSELLQKSPLEYQIMHKPIFITVYFTAQMHYFMVRVANFEALYLRHFWVKIQSFSAH